MIFNVNYKKCDKKNEIISTNNFKQKYNNAKYYALIKQMKSTGLYFHVGGYFWKHSLNVKQS